MTLRGGRDCPVPERSIRLSLVMPLHFELLQMAPFAAEATFAARPLFRWR